jgi:hypothetical protein
VYPLRPCFCTRPCPLAPSPARRSRKSLSLPGWGWTAAQLGDKEVVKKLKEGDPDYVDPTLIVAAQSLLRTVMCVGPGGRGVGARTGALFDDV